MRLVTLPIAGAGGRSVIINAEHVVCIVDLGDKRSQVVTTGLSGEASISLLVDLSPPEVASRLEVAADRPSRRVPSRPPPLMSRVDDSALHSDF